MDELDKLVNVSRYLGQDADKVQGGGGNTSVKVAGGKMFVKASGITLKEADRNSFVMVDPGEVIDILYDDSVSSLEPRDRDKAVSEKITGLVKYPTPNRPSIETFLHALLGKYVAHSHPVLVNALTCLEGGATAAEGIFKGHFNYLWVGYGNPGYPLGILLRDSIKAYQAQQGLSPEIIFLQNHGIIISAENESAVNTLLEEVIGELKGVFENVPPPPAIVPHVSIFKGLITMLTDVFAQAGIAQIIFQPAKSQVINSVLQRDDARLLFVSKALYPDQVVYCGEYPLYFDACPSQKDILLALQEFISRFGCPPKVIVFKGEGVVLAGKSLREIHAIEETLEAHLKTLLLIEKSGRPAYLSRRDTAYIANWESEKYRRELMAEGAI